MILVDWQIREKCLAGMVSPFDDSLINPASLDIRIGDTVLIPTSHNNWQRFWIKNDEPLLIKPGEFLLTETMETFEIPEDICGQFRLKSSRGREGWEHSESGFIDPGFFGSKLTLELKNINHRHSLELSHGMRIGQIVFSKLAGVPEKSYRITGRYNNDQSTTVSKG